MENEGKSPRDIIIEHYPGINIPLTTLGGGQSAVFTAQSGRGTFIKVGPLPEVNGFTAQTRFADPALGIVDETLRRLHWAIANKVETNPLSDNIAYETALIHVAGEIAKRGLGDDSKSIIEDDSIVGAKSTTDGKFAILELRSEGSSNLQQTLKEVGLRKRPEDRLDLTSRFITGLGQVARALETLHNPNARARGNDEYDQLVYILRDLKLGNLVGPTVDELFRAGGTPKITIIDLGLAQTSIGTNPFAFGTPKYIAPEYVLDGESFSTEADNYALAVVLLAFLCGTENVLKRKAEAARDNYNTKGKYQPEFQRNGMYVPSEYSQMIANHLGIPRDNAHRLAYAIGRELRTAPEERLPNALILTSFVDLMLKTLTIAADPVFVGPAITDRLGFLDNLGVLIGNYDADYIKDQEVTAMVEYLSDPNNAKYLGILEKSFGVQLAGQDVDDRLSKAGITNRHPKYRVYRLLAYVNPNVTGKLTS